MSTPLDASGSGLKPGNAGISDCTKRRHRSNAIALNQCRQADYRQVDNSIAAIVTGGASGLGRAIAEALAAKRAKVAILDMNPDAGRAVADAIGASSANST